LGNTALLLIENSFKEELDELGDARIALMAQSVLPVFWFSLFSPHEIRIRVVPETSACEPTSFPVLFTGIADAKKRARERKATFLRYFPKEIEKTYTEWVDFITSVEHLYVEIEAVEVYGLYPEEYEGTLIACARAWETGQVDDWIVMAEQAALDFDRSANQMAITSFDPVELEYRLIGYVDHPSTVDIKLN
jgi:hypothetical protein